MTRRLTGVDVAGIGGGVTMPPPSLPPNHPDRHSFSRRLGPEFTGPAPPSMLTVSTDSVMLILQCRGPAGHAPGRELIFSLMLTVEQQRVARLPSTLSAVARVPDEGVSPAPREAPFLTPMTQISHLAADGGPSPPLIVIDSGLEAGGVDRVVPAGNGDIASQPPWTGKQSSPAGFGGHRAPRQR